MSTPAEQLAVWNALLNPPSPRSSLLDLEFEQDILDWRNKFVASYLNATNAKAKALVRDQLADLDQTHGFARLHLPVSHLEMNQVLAIRDKLAEGKLESFKVRDVDDLRELKAEMVKEVVRRSEKDPVRAVVRVRQSSVEAYVNQYLFSDFKLDKHGRAVWQPDFEFPSLDAGLTDGGYSPLVVRQYSSLAQDHPEYIRHNERVWKLLEDGALKGRVDPSVLWLMNEAGKDNGPVDDEVYLEVLRTYGVHNISFDYSGRERILSSVSDPEEGKSLVEQMVDEYLGDWDELSEWVFQGFSDDGPETFSRGVNEGGVYQFQEGGVEDQPVFGSHQRNDAYDFELFRTFHWEFDKDIAYNVDKMLREPRFVNEGLHPAVGVLPEDWLSVWEEDDLRSVLRKQLRILQNDLVNSSSAGRYDVELAEGEASVEAAFQVFKTFHETFGTNGSKYSRRLVEEFQVDEDLTWAESIRVSNLNRAKALEYLERTLDPGEKPSDELIAEVETKTALYRNLGHMLEDRGLKTQVRERHQDRLDERRFDDAGLNMDLSNVRENQLKIFMSGYLGSADYNEFLKGERDTDYYELVDTYGLFKGLPEARRDEAFMGSVDSLIARYRQATIDQKAEDAATEARADIFSAEKALSDDTTLFRNRLTRLFREVALGSDGSVVSGGVINADSDPAFVKHIDDNIIPRIIQKAYYGNKPYGTEAEVEAIYDAALDRDPFYGLEAYDYDPAFFDVQFDERQPPPFPGVPGARFVDEDRYAPPFDVSAFSGVIDSAAIESPEFASFLSTELGSPTFEETWQEAAMPRARRDRGAELDAADARVSSFEAAVERAVFARGDRQRNLSAARENLQIAERTTGADLTAPPAEDAVTQAESAMRSGAGGVARAQSALEDAQARAAREKGEVTAEYFVMEKPGLHTAAEKARVAAGGIAPGPKTLPTGKQRPVTSLFTQDGGVWNIDPYQYARERREAYIEPGLTQEEFYERELPGLTERYKGSSLYAREQERLTASRLDDERRRISDERDVERVRRNRLSRSRAMNVFGRRA